MARNKKKRTGQKISVLIALIIMVLALDAVALYEGQALYEEKKLEEMTEGFNLLELYQQNSDLAGWIQIKGTNINYPVMHGERYINRNFEGRYSSQGLPFRDNACSERSINTLIYAHNMRYNGTMFHHLEEYGSKAFWESHQEAVYYSICFDIYGEPFVRKDTYRILSVIQTKTTDWNFRRYTSISTAEQAQQYMEDCKSRDLYETGVEPTDRLITLSTCSYHVRGRDGRLVVVGTRIDTVRQDTVDAT